MIMIQLEKSIWKSILDQFIKSKDWTMDLYVIMIILKKEKYKNILNMFIQKKSNNWSICDFSFSTIDILKDMPIIFMRTGCQKTCTSCEYDSSKKFNSKEHTEPIHIKKILNNSSVCDHGYSQKRKNVKTPWICLFKR